MPTSAIDPIRFPEGFLWGTATAGHQIEGNNTHSNWWEWEQEGLVNDGSKSGLACDYWNRWHEDHEFMETEGHSVFRLGVEWARIEPERGRFDDAAIAHYRTIIDDLQERGIRVCLTLNHWVLPLWLSREGGWLSSEVLDYWDSFVSIVANRLGESVDLWITINEPMVPILAGYLAGYHPPCHRNPPQAARVFAQQLRAHSSAYRILHEQLSESPTGGPVMVGYAGAYQFVEPFHETGFWRSLESPMARIIRRVSYSAWDRSVETGRVAFPFGIGQQIEGLAGSTDFIGVNYYMRISAQLGPGTLSNVKATGYAIPEGIEMTEMGWQVYPPGFYEVLMELHRSFGKPMYITENGCCDSGDKIRRRYLISHWAQMHRAIRDGCDLRGYMHWSFADNFEWREGFEKKFGLIEMDHQDPELKRRPRQSAELLRQVIEENGITQDIIDRHAPGALDRWPR